MGLLTSLRGRGTGKPQASGPIPGWTPASRGRGGVLQRSVYSTALHSPPPMPPAWTPGDRGSDAAPPPGPPRLLIELTPVSSWDRSVRGLLTAAQWAIVRQAVCLTVDRCEICGVKVQAPVECHEVWDYDDDLAQQTLVRMATLCSPCHLVK
ncbi:MAG: hypothetical protein ACRDYC_00370, partial [Acidimicrobiales bacterium]